MTKDLPWGVTANLIARRNIRDDVCYDVEFPKTGGGEDIDFCRRKRQFSLEHGGEGFCAAPNVIVTHPWWCDGKRSYLRFYMWSMGDGALVKRFPEHSYRDYAPNSAELLSFCVCLLAIGSGNVIFFNAWRLFTFALELMNVVILVNVIYDLHRHLWRNADRTKTINSTISGSRWAMAVVESAFLRMASELGRVIGMLLRGEILLLGTRFDWFTNHPSTGSGPRDEERKNNLEKMLIVLALMGVFLGLS